MPMHDLKGVIARITFTARDIRYKVRKVGFFKKVYRIDICVFHLPHLFRKYFDTIWRYLDSISENNVILLYRKFWCISIGGERIEIWIRRNKAFISVKEGQAVMRSDRPYRTYRPCSWYRSVFVCYSPHYRAADINQGTGNHPATDEKRTPRRSLRQVFRNFNLRAWHSARRNTLRILPKKFIAVLLTWMRWSTWATQMRSENWAL